MIWEYRVTRVQNIIPGVSNRVYYYQIAEVTYNDEGGIYSIGNPDDLCQPNRQSLLDEVIYRINALRKPVIDKDGNEVEPPIGIKDTKMLEPKDKNSYLEEVSQWIRQMPEDLQKIIKERKI